jgi:hypothetical protein
MGIWGDNGARRPSEYAARIERLPTREARGAALDDVPPHLRDLVRAMVVADLSLLNGWAARVASGAVNRNDVPAVIRQFAARLGRNI